MSKQLFFELRELEMALLTREQVAQQKQIEEKQYESSESNNKRVQEVKGHRRKFRW